MKILLLVMTMTMGSGKENYSVNQVDSIKEAAVDAWRYKSWHIYKNKGKLYEINLASMTVTEIAIPEVRFK